MSMVPSAEYIYRRYAVSYTVPTAAAMAGNPSVSGCRNDVNAGFSVSVTDTILPLAATHDNTAWLHTTRMNG